MFKKIVEWNHRLIYWMIAEFAIIFCLSLIAGFYHPKILLYIIIGCLYALLITIGLAIVACTLWTIKYIADQIEFAKKQHEETLRKNSKSI